MNSAAALTDDELDLAFAALSDRTRHAMLATLCQRDATVLELAAPFAMSQPAVTKHLKVLERAGLISRRKEAQRRPCHLEPQRLEQVAAWLGTYREYWDASYQRLDELLTELQASPPRPEAPAPKETARATPARDRRPRR